MSSQASGGRIVNPDPGYRDPLTEAGLTTVKTVAAASSLVGMATKKEAPDLMERKSGTQSGPSSLQPPSGGAFPSPSPDDPLADPPVGDYPVAAAGDPFAAAAGKFSLAL